MIEHVDGERGIWLLWDGARKKLRQAATGVRLAAFSTDLGLAVWARAQSVFPALGEPIALCVTSPPYSLRQSRAYGNPTEAPFVDFL